MRQLYIWLTAAIFFTACNSANNNTAGTDSATKENNTTGTISDVRENPKKEPVDIYEKKVPNDLNDWYFRVKLYETPNRFVYRMVMEYEAIVEEKEINFPNFGQEPQPKINKGAEDYEALVGFMDKSGTFREYLKVFVEGGNLQLKQLKFYAVAPK